MTKESSLVKNRFESNKQYVQQVEDKIKEERAILSPLEQEQATEVRRHISGVFAEQLRNANDITDLSEEITEAIVAKCALLDVPYESQKKIERSVLMTVLGNGPIQEYMDDTEVTEIVVQRYDNIVIEKNGKIQKAKAVFNNEDELQVIISRIVQQSNKQINLMCPIVDTRLPDGSRVNAVFPPVSPDGAQLTIRKFATKVLSGNDYVKVGSMDKRMLYFLERCVKGKITLFVSGGTGSGKTTLLNMLSGYIPPDELIITIEDTCELKLKQPNIRRMEVRLSNNEEMMQVDQNLLVKEALRQRPDRIILGEVRDKTIVDLISALSTGHEGSMSTIHANDPYNMCNTRIPILYSMSDTNFSERSVSMQISEAIQVIIQISRYPDGKRRISCISEVTGVDENGRVVTQDIFTYNRKNECFEPTGYVPVRIIEKIENRGYEFSKKLFGGEDG